MCKSYWHIDYAPVDDCKNLDSFGMICLGPGCNQCGRFDDEKKESDQK
jgi:hypothetical protein